MRKTRNEGQGTKEAPRRVKTRKKVKTIASCHARTVHAQKITRLKKAGFREQEMDG